MPYSVVYLIVGVVVTDEQLKAIPSIETEDEDNYVAHTIKKTKNGDIDLYVYPACSKIGGKKFIIGSIEKTWVRKLSKCAECEDDSCCNTCIGQTEYGHYDVEKILNQVVECPLKNVCMYCWRDNKKTIMKGCRACGHIPNWDMRFNTPADNKFKDKPIVKEVEKYMQKKHIEGEVKIYYAIDFCLCCS